MTSELTLLVSDFVALVNQTLEFAYSVVTVSGELANFRISKNRWVYFDLKDELAMVRCFGTVYHLPGPLEDGMTLAVRGAPRLHPQFGFSLNVLSIMPTGEGSIKKAAQLLEAKLKSEGLFDESHKRPLPYPPQKIGLITSKESAAVHDFLKIINARWPALKIKLIDVQVQGAKAVQQITAAIRQFNEMAASPDVLVMIRGGGSTEDLAAFNTEPVTRAVAASRIPTLVAIGHEVDISLAELAADRRASTPSNAAELLVPDRKTEVRAIQQWQRHLQDLVMSNLNSAKRELSAAQEILDASVEQVIKQARQNLYLQGQLLQAYNPELALKRGYAVLYKDGAVVYSGQALRAKDKLHATLSDATIDLSVECVTIKESHE